MTEGEAKIVAALLMSADGWCGNCGSALFDQAEAIWPEFSWKEWEKTAMFAYKNDSEFSLWDDYSCQNPNHEKINQLLTSP
jgi:hypothetical protein